MSQSGFEMFSNVAGMVIVIADVIFFLCSLEHFL